MYTDILIKPVMTEKMAILEERQNKYAFFVKKTANKIQIKKAVELKFDVKVVKVHTINRMGKLKQMTVKSGGRTIRTSGKRAGFKKAIITIEDGQTIDFIRGESVN